MASQVHNDACVITCFFNPCRYTTRLTNFFRFAASLEAHCIPWFAVECVFGDTYFELPRAANIKRVRAGSVMWQKERLLNLALKELVPVNFSRIVWLDADVIFAEPDWLVRTSLALDGYPVVQ